MPLHIRNPAGPEHEARIVPKRGPVRYEWHVTALCGQLVPVENSVSGDARPALLYTCDDCLTVRAAR